MARDAVTITALSSGVAATNPAGTAINTANGANIAAAGDTSRLLIRITNTNGTNRVATIKAGSTNPPAVRKGLGDYAITVPATTGDVVVVVESARFLQADGSINVDFAASMAGVISAVRLPKGA
jgi:hypothetical protein